MEPREVKPNPTGLALAGGEEAPGAGGVFQPERATPAGGARAEEWREAVLRWLEEELPEPVLTFKPSWWERGEVIYENFYADGQYFGIKRFKNGIYALVVNFQFP